MRADERAIFATLNDAFGVCILGEEREDMRHHKIFIFLLRQCNYLIRIINGNGDGFFDEGMFARVEGCHADRFVQLRRQADIHQIDFFIGEERVNLAIFADMREIFDAAARTEVALNPGPVAVQFFGIACANRYDFGTGDALDAVVVDHAHKPDADNANFYHVYIQEVMARLESAPTGF